MKLHFFNPEHDIALATNVRRFTAPHAARQLRSDLGFLPALWADDGDIVLVDDVESAVRRSRHLKQFMADVLFVSAGDLRSMAEQGLGSLEIGPWGWDWGIADELARIGLGRFVPSDEQLAQIRLLSNRRWAAERLLPRLRRAVQFPTVGIARCLSNHAELAQISEFPVVLKAPWSSSGRGIRYVSDAIQLARNLSWARRNIVQQGSLMLEPYYNKVCDFGMEFEAQADGTVVYKGLSLFMTKNGSYVGNIIATERAKQETLTRFVPAEVQKSLAEAVCSIVSKEFAGQYAGPFGIDMMIVRGTGSGDCDGLGKSDIALHPCVELNLRRTMGHVALSLPCADTMPQRTMRISLTDRYRLTIAYADKNPYFLSSVVR